MRMERTATDNSTQSISDMLLDDLASQEAQPHVDRIFSLYRSLCKEADLRPSASINAIFGELVGLCTQTLSKEVTKTILGSDGMQDVIPGLRNLCAHAEGFLESHWARFISDGANKQEVQTFLEEFPYYQNYVDLTRLELAALQAVTPTLPRKIAFIGSGPLPLTSLCLLRSINSSYSPKSLFQQLLSWFSSSSSARVLNIDHSHLALKLSSSLCSKLGSVAEGMTFLLQDALSPELRIASCDVVYLAALVGCTQIEKEVIVRNVVSQMTEGALVIIRTSWGLRGLLYPEFDYTTPSVLSVLEICVVVHPYDHVVNSVVVGRVRARGRENLA